MVRQNDLAPAVGSKRKRKRVGRGDGSGHGSYSGRGSKGQKARSGAHVPPRFEGGQLPLVKRLPRLKGFTHLSKQEYSIVNVGKLGIFESGSEVTPEKLLETGIVRTLRKPVKILGEGEVSQPLIVKAAAFSASAREKIRTAGGMVEKIRDATKTK